VKHVIASGAKQSPLGRSRQSGDCFVSTWCFLAM